MNFKKLLVVITVLAVVLSACAPKKSAPAPVVTLPTGCKDHMNISIFGVDGESGIPAETIDMPYSWKKDNTDLYVKVYDELSEYYQFMDNLNSKVDEYNKLVGPLFGSGIVSNYPTLTAQGDISSYSWKSSGLYETTWYAPTDCEERDIQNRVFFDFGMSEQASGAYPVTTNTVNERVFVTITSPAGSIVKYSFPTKLLHEAFINVFYQGSFTMPQGQFETVEVSADQSDFTSSLLQNLVSDGEGTESVYFSFKTDDFEGRRVLKPMIARALEISAGEYDKPVVAVLDGYSISGYKTITTVTAENDGINVHGWMTFRSGALDASGGGSSFSSNTQTTLEDMVKGSIYLTPVQ